MGFIGISARTHMLIISPDTCFFKKTNSIIFHYNILQEKNFSASVKCMGEKFDLVQTY